MERNTVSHAKLCLKIRICCVRDTRQCGSTHGSRISTCVDQGCQSNRFHLHIVGLTRSEDIPLWIRYANLKFLETGQGTLKPKNLLIPWLVVKLLWSIGQRKINLRTHILGKHCEALSTRFRGSLLITTLVIHEHQKVRIGCECVLWSCGGCTFVSTQVGGDYRIGWEGNKWSLRKHRTDQPNSDDIGRS